MGITVVIKGADLVSDRLQEIQVRAAILSNTRAMTAAEFVLGEIKAETPVGESGFLRGSSEVRSDGNNIVFSDPMKYAEPVHNIPEPPAKSEGGRSAHHKIGKWHYVIDPVMRNLTELQNAIQEDLNEMVESVAHGEGGGQ